eukprot:13641973-Heterocapsa_arctica.AAC.1
MEAIARALEPGSSRSAVLVDCREVDSDGDPELVEIGLALDDFQERSGEVGINEVDGDVAMPHSDRVLNGCLEAADVLDSDGDGRDGDGYDNRL